MTDFDRFKAAVAKSKKNRLVRQVLNKLARTAPAKVRALLRGTWGVWGWAGAAVWAGCEGRAGGGCRGGCWTGEGAAPWGGCTMHSAYAAAGVRRGGWDEYGWGGAWRGCPEAKPSCQGRTCPNPSPSMPQPLLQRVPLASPLLNLAHFPPTPRHILCLRVPVQLYASEGPQPHRGPASGSARDVARPSSIHSSIHHPRDGRCPLVAAVDRQPPQSSKCLGD